MQLNFRLSFEEEGAIEVVSIALQASWLSLRVLRPFDFLMDGHEFVRAFFGGEAMVCFLLLIVKILEEM
jgi:hypothetical protein